LGGGGGKADLSIFLSAAFFFPALDFAFLPILTINFVDSSLNCFSRFTAHPLPFFIQLTPLAARSPSERAFCFPTRGFISRSNKTAEKEKKTSTWKGSAALTGYKNSEDNLLGS